MNERIKKLAIEAGLSEMPSNYSDMADLYKGADFELEKFAELIVRECCDIFVELRTRPADLAALDVKKHFGIKE
jgi:hypothetical protein